jgi:hypothetical protein
MKIIVTSPCGGLSPKTKRPFSFAASALPIEVEDAVGKDLIKAGYATAVKASASRKTAAKKESE